VGERELGERVDAQRRPYETHWQMNPRTRAVLDEALDAAMAARGGRPPSVVLDVGCGRQSNVVFPGAELVVGTDIDGEGLAGNRTVDIAIAGDIVATDLPERSVDAIACIYVLEHVRHPDLVLAKFARALRPGGVLVVAVPNVAAPKAKITRWTPLSFHTFVYRRLLGRNDPNTGLPFATVLDPSIRPDRIEELARDIGLRVLLRRDFEDNKQRQLRQRIHLDGRAWSLVRRACRGLTGGRVDPADSDVVFALERIADPAPSELARALEPAAA